MRLGEISKGVESDGTFRAPSHSRSTSNMAGFTLIELLVAITIMPLIVGALALGLIAVLKLQPGVSGRLADVSDSQVVGTVFQTDVQGATGWTTGTTASCGTGTQLFGLQFADGSVVSYAEVLTGTTETLQRFHCSSGTTPNKTTILSFDLPSSQQAPTFTCSSTCASLGGGWFSTAGASSVTFTVTEPRSSLNYTLVAVPGLWNNGSGGVPGGGSTPAIIMLSDCGTGGNTPALSMSGNSTVTVGTAPNYSPIQVNPACANNGISVSNPATLNDGPISKSSSDPLAGAVAPTNPSASATTGCTGTSCAAGDYSTMPTLNNNGSLTFASGTYVFEQPFVIPNGATVVFLGGTIWFEGGLIVNDGSVTFDSGTVIFGNSSTNTCTGLECLTMTSGSSLTSAPPGVLLYVEAGSTNLAAGSTVSLAGLQNAGGISNSDIALWDAAASGSNYPLTFNSGSSGSANGGIYAPTGNVSMSQNGIGQYAYIDANTLTISNSTNLGTG